MFELQSADISELAKALNAAQSEMRTATKDAENPYFKSHYADLGSVWEAIKFPLSKNGLSIVQGADFMDGQTFLVTTLMHTSGQWIRSRYPLNPVKNDPQAYGSAVTYARRYMLSAMMGVVADDDDGEKAMNRITPQQIAKMTDIIKSKLQSADSLQKLQDAWISSQGDIKTINQYSPTDYASLVDVKDSVKAQLQKPTVEGICKAFIACSTAEELNALAVKHENDISEFKQSEQDIVKSQFNACLQKFNVGE